MSTLSSRIRDLAPGLRLRAESFQAMAREARHTIAESQAKIDKGVFSGEEARLRAVIRGQTARAADLDRKAEFALAESKAASAGVLLSTTDRILADGRDPRVNAILREGFEAGVVKRFTPGDWLEDYVPPPPEPTTLAEHRQARGLHPDPSTDPVAPDAHEQLRQGQAQAVEEQAQPAHDARPATMLVGGW